MPEQIAGMAPLVFAAAAIVILVASIVQTNLGMGFGMTAGPLVALIDPALVPAPVLLLSFTTAFVPAVKNRGSVVWPHALVALAGRAAGTALGVVVLAHLPDVDTFSLVFGLVILFALALSVFARPFEASLSHLGLAGLCSGAMAAITTVGGSPMALVYASQPPAKAKGTLGAFFAMGAVVSIIGLTLSGHLGRPELLAALTLAPFMVAGIVLAPPLQPFIDRRYRLALHLMSFVAAILLIARGLV